MNTTTINGSTVGWTDTGEGDATLLIHAGGFGAWFDPMANLLSGRTINMRRTGYVGAPPAGALVDIGEHAAHAASLLDRLGATPATVVAHSSGCVIGLQLALDHPDLVSRLVLSEPPLIQPLMEVLLEPAEVAAAGEALGPQIGAALGAAAAGEIPQALDTFLNAVCGPDYRATVTEALGPGWHDQAERDAAFFFANEIPALMTWAIDDLTRITTPTLLVQGGESPPLTHRLIAQLAATVPYASVATIAGANHLVPLSHPEQLARLVARS